MHRRRRPHSHSAPQPPSASALIAASAVYRSATPSLAAAAAGAALRRASTASIPLEQRTGSIPTKRMLKRRDSYSSVPSDSDQRPPMQRRVSSSGSSLSERRFRTKSPARRASTETKEPERPPAPTPRAGAGAGRTRWSSSSSSSSDGGEFARSASLRSTRSFPTTLRGSAGKKLPSKLKPKPKPTTSMLSRGSLRDSASESRRRRSLETDATRRTTLAIARLSHGDHGGSTSSLTTSELESIAEDDTVKPEDTMTRVPEASDSDSEGPRDTFEFTRKGSGRRRATGIGVQSWDAVRASSETPPKHSPPPRSVSPAKSALKHTPAPSSPPSTTAPGPARSEAGSANRVRVSFSDEERVLQPPREDWLRVLQDPLEEHERVMQLVPQSLREDRRRLVPLSSREDAPSSRSPMFPSPRRSGTVRNGLVPAVLAPSPPTSNSSIEDLDTAWLRALCARPAQSPVPVPVVVLTAPRKDDGALALGSLDAVIAGDTAADSDSDSGGGGSIYEDAYEDLPDALVATTPDPVRLLTPQPARPDTPPLPPDFLRALTPTTHHHDRCPPSLSSGGDSDDDSTDSDAPSVSSFRRLHPRQQRRTGMVRSLRTNTDSGGGGGGGGGGAGAGGAGAGAGAKLSKAPPPPRLRSSLRGAAGRDVHVDGNGDGGRFKSRFAGDSDDDDDAAEVRKTGTGTGRKGFWRALSRRVVDVDVDVGVGVEKEEGEKVEKVGRKKLKSKSGSKSKSKSGVRKREVAWVGDEPGLKTVITGGAEPVVEEPGGGGGGEGEGAVEGVVGRKRFGRLKKLLRLA